MTERPNDRLANLKECLSLVAEFSPKTKVFLVLLPFIILVGVYLAASDMRFRENKDDKFLPWPTKMAEATYKIAFTEDKRTGRYLMLDDTIASLRRIGIGMSLSAGSSVVAGIVVGLFPLFRLINIGLLTFLTIIPPLAILPIFFMVFGVDELVKIMLIFVGTFPWITRDIAHATEKIPKEQIVKSLTLGASRLQVARKIVFPQIMPILMNTTRLSLGSAWLLLIAAEGIAATSGLGYRIFLMSRYLNTEIIIPYVLWITFLGFVVDWTLKKFIGWNYAWYKVEEDT